jgi:thiamine-phosphate pyrophosphorylase
LFSGGVLLRDFLPRLEAALKAADVACLLIAAPAEVRDDDLRPIAEPLIRAAQARDVAALLSGRAALAKPLGADGVHLDLGTASASDAMRAYRDARQVLAEDAIVGALCPPERHLAMEIAEAGADYVGFDLAAPEAEDTIAWWGEIMTVPCIAFGRLDPATAGALARSGADFIAPEPELWRRVDPGSDLAALQATIRAG